MKRKPRFSFFISLLDRYLFFVVPSVRPIGHINSSAKGLKEKRGFVPPNPMLRASNVT